MELITILAIFGGGFLFTIVTIIIMFCFLWIRETIERAIYLYNYKHRFDKPPTAKCYCRDCRKWDPLSGDCYDDCNCRKMGPSWFCCFAEPLSKEEAAEREEYLNGK